MNHREIVTSLCGFLTALGIHCEKELIIEPAWGAGSDYPILDVWAYGHAASRLAFMVFEIKAQRSDLLQDIRTKKFEKYLRYCSRFYFAFEAGLARPEEIPLPAGIVEFVAGQGWKLIRQSRPLPFPELSTANMEALLRRRIPTPSWDKPQIKVGLGTGCDQHGESAARRPESE